MLYKALFQPHFDYCSIIWFNAGKILVKQLSILQNRALRITLKVDSRYSTNLIYAYLKIDRLESRWYKQAALFVFKLLHKILPMSLCSKINVKEYKHNLRNSESIISLDKPKTNYLKEGSLYSSIKLFNSLPC